MDERIDILNRQHFVQGVGKVIHQLSAHKKGCCFAIEGSWGIGKTFVLEEIEEKIKRTEDKYFLFHYNCWQYDYYEEPAVAVISAMISSFERDRTIFNKDLEDTVEAGYLFVGKKLKEIAGLYLKNRIGVDLISWAGEIASIKKGNASAEYNFDKMFNFSQTIEMVRKDLQEMAEQRTILLVVDELDRCIPQYAIKVLERLHHIFYGLDNVIVILAIDRRQLEHSVEEMFGINSLEDKRIDVEKYLKKFIDFSMELDGGEMSPNYFLKYRDYFNKFFVTEDDNLQSVTDLLLPLLKTLDIRQQEKMIEKISMVHSIACAEKIHISVLGFEILFEILDIWGFGDKKYLVLINNAHYITLEQKLGDKLELLKTMEKKSWVSKRGMEDKKVVKTDLLGKIFWYFANIFNVEEIPYQSLYKSDEEVQKNILAAKGFCEFHKYLK